MAHPAPLILGFDTSGPYCAAALLRGDMLLGAQVADMKRGQAEALMPLLQDLLATHDAAWRDLTALGVGIGPGNFTGIRISVSAARGLALGLGIPAVGVSTFQALSRDHDEPHQAAVPAPRDQLYLLDSGDATPRLAPADEPSALPRHLPPATPRLVHNIALCALDGHQGPRHRPAPLYVKPADAAPPRDPAPLILK